MDRSHLKRRVLGSAVISADDEATRLDLLARTPFLLHIRTMMCRSTHDTSRSLVKVVDFEFKTETQCGTLGELFKYEPFCTMLSINGQLGFGAFIVIRTVPITSSHIEVAPISSNCNHWLESWGKHCIRYILYK
jgi:hypothetical protein